MSNDEFLLTVDQKLVAARNAVATMINFHHQNLHHLRSVTNSDFTKNILASGLRASQSIIDYYCSINVNMQTNQSNTNVYDWQIYADKAKPTIRSRVWIDQYFPGQDLGYFNFVNPIGSKLDLQVSHNGILMLHAESEISDSGQGRVADLVKLTSHLGSPVVSIMVTRTKGFQEYKNIHKLVCLRSNHRSEPFISFVYYVKNDAEFCEAQINAAIILNGSVQESLVYP